MNNTLSQQTSHNQASNINPFARALAEARGGQSSDTGIPPGFGGMDQSRNTFEQQREQAEKLKKERLRQQLHREVNPVEAHDVFNAREQQVKREIDNIRHELKLLIQEVQGFEKEIDMTLMSNVAQPGQDGTYYITFFQKLRAFIMLLREKVHSARTWATAFNSKKRKKSHAPGLDISGQSYEQTTTVFDRAHHERSTAYSGS